MNESDDGKPEDAITETRETSTSPAVDEPSVTARPRATGRKNVLIVIGTFVAIVLLAVLAWVYLGKRSSGAGRAVPAPSNVNTTPTTGSGTSVGPTTESTFTVAPEMITRAGIKIEPVGEQLAAASEGSGPLATGIVQANTYRSSPLVSLVGGILREVKVELGQRVSRGQTLAVVFSNELAETQSRYLTSLAELTEHQKHHLRTIKLIEIGAASREELEQATTLMNSAESGVAALRQRLILLGLSSQRVNALRSPSQISSDVALPSPVSGTVVSRTANPGEVIEANREIVRVADLSSVWVIGQLYEKDLALVRVGSGASITSAAYPGKVFRGNISYVDPQIDSATRTAQIRIELANPGQILKIGMYVNVAFATIGTAASTSPVIPVNAVQNINGRQVVFVATADASVFEMRTVRLGPESQGFYPVLEGLTPGERIVTEGSFSMRAEWIKLHPSSLSQPGSGSPSM
jgi:RND family efflux transporter MFP subunit